MIEPEVVQAIADQVSAHGWEESVLGGLRAAYPTVHFTYCLDEDILHGKPAVSSAGGNVYLVDGREHCLCLTDDYEAATGLVLAQCSDGEE